MAAILLWKFGLSSVENYHMVLNQKFLNSSDDELLLELECSSSDCDASFNSLMRFWNYEYTDFNQNKFGKILFSLLETAYKRNFVAIKDFGDRCYQLWQCLPGSICNEEPFLTLSYADDGLSYGDESRTKMLYEKAFQFYQ